MKQVCNSLSFSHRPSFSYCAGHALRVTSTVADHLRNVRRNTVKHILVSASEESWSTPAQEQSDAVATYVSASGRLLVILKELRPSDSSATKRFVEVWRGDALLAVKDVTDVHGAFYTDGRLLFKGG